MYSQLNAEAYASFRKLHLRQKGSPRQRALITAACDNAAFLDYVRSRVGTDDGDEIAVVGTPLSEGEYRECPIDTEAKLYDSWADITPETACRVGFWGEVTLQHIEGSDEGENQRRIQSHYLAANGGNLPGGLARIDKALSNEGSAKDIDSCVRAILRRLSGLPEARGNKTQYVDCPFGRAWWRIRWSNEIAESSGMSVHAIRQLLHVSKSYWEELVVLVVSRNSILGDRKVRDALIWTLAEIREADTNHKMLKTDPLKAICRLLGIRFAWQELGILDLNEIKQLIDGEIQSLA